MKENINPLGQPTPLGCTPLTLNGTQGFNFALFSSAAEKVELCLFEQGIEQRFPMASTPCREVWTERDAPQDGVIWHLWLPQAKAGMQYGYRIFAKKSDLAIQPNPQKLMLDPYVKGVQGKPDLSSETSRQPYLLSDDQDNADVALKGVILDETFDWQGDVAPQHAWSDTIIYELHVKGFTALQEKIPAPLRGTYAGLAQPAVIAYLKDLGITAVELLPVQYHVDERHLQERGLRNYWGYNPVAMFALEQDYSITPHKPADTLNEFKQMVKTLHKAGIEVILDVVFNHSAESEQDFPTFSQRGIDDQTYYWRDDNGHYLNVTGCGNVLNVATVAGRRWVVDCLRYWVEECHVDGFRFDLASTLGRDTPAFNPQAQLFADILAVPSLHKVKLIAEPWDIGLGGYQVGQFPSSFAEWNDRFRDDMTKFWLWKTGELGTFAQRFAGSSDIYQDGEKRPHHSVNFITAHDGFTLRDLCSYNQKHNEANGEDNRDGRNENYSYNHGVEGSDLGDDSVQNARLLSSQALLTSLLLANGMPMLLAGDEFGHSQQGNNNTYCQDNALTWLDWSKLNSPFSQQLFRRCRAIIALRKQIPSLQQDDWWSGENVQWYNIDGDLMTVNDWHNTDCKAMQIQLDERWLLLINDKAQPQCYQLPPLPKGQIWQNNLSSQSTVAENVTEAACWTYVLDGLEMAILKRQLT